MIQQFHSRIHVSKRKKKENNNSKAPVFVKLEFYHFAWAKHIFRAEGKPFNKDFLHRAQRRKFYKDDEIPPYFIPVLSSTIVNISNNPIVLSGEMKSLVIHGDLEYKGNTFDAIGIMTVGRENINVHDEITIIAPGESVHGTLPPYMTYELVKAINNGKISHLSLQINGEEFTWSMTEFEEAVQYSRDVIGCDYDMLKENTEKYIEE